MVTQASGFEAPWEDLIEFWHLSLLPLDLFHLCVSFGIMSLRFGLYIVWILVELTSRGKSILWNCLSGWESMKATFMNKLYLTLEFDRMGLSSKLKKWLVTLIFAWPKVTPDLWSTTWSLPIIFWQTKSFSCPAQFDQICKTKLYNTYIYGNLTYLYLLYFVL